MRPLLIGAAALAAVVAILGGLVGLDVRALLDLDLQASSALHPGPGVAVLQVLTAPGLTIFRFVALAPVALLLFVRGQRRVASFVVMAAVTVGPLTTLLKELVGRVRPTADDPLVAADGLSFPSGHSSGAATLVGVLIVVLWPVVARRWRPWLVGALCLLALCVAWTRIALGVHYLSDVAAGLALGALVVVVWMAVLGLYPGGAASLSRRGQIDIARRPG